MLRTSRLTKEDKQVLEQASILVVDDDKEVLKSLEHLFKTYNVKHIKLLDRWRKHEVLQTLNSFDVIILDVNLWSPHHEIMPEVLHSTLEEIRQKDKELPVILYTNYSEFTIIREALRLGATDYILKSEDNIILLRAIINAIKYRKAVKIVKRVEEEIHNWAETYKLVGVSKAIKEIQEQIKIAAKTDSHVLILGETGVGKEHVARLIHYYSPRAKEPFVVVDCSSITETLVPSAFFGHVEGAFTDAKESKGFFRQADGGTIFLDEILNLSITSQRTLLRVLDRDITKKRTLTIVPIGGMPVEVDVRVIMATNRNPEEEIRENRLAPDFYQRISTITIEVPPLRKRPEDIPLLLEYYLKKFRSELGKETPTQFSKQALEVLTKYDWPGNVRELRNLVERLVTFANSETITIEHIQKFFPGIFNVSAEYPFSVVMTFDKIIPLQEASRNFEKEYITTVIKLTNNSKSKAAQLLSIDRSTLYRKLERK